MKTQFIIYRLLVAAWFAAGLLHAQNPLSVSKPEKDNTVKGPSLSAVAAGLQVDLLVESVLWPARQIKEGCVATTVDQLRPQRRQNRAVRPRHRHRPNRPNQATYTRGIRDALGPHHQPYASLATRPHQISLHAEDLRPTEVK
jgi:hypothetical protein